MRRNAWRRDETTGGQPHQDLHEHPALVHEEPLPHIGDRLVVGHRKRGLHHRVPPIDRFVDEMDRLADDPRPIGDCALEDRPRWMQASRLVGILGAGKCRQQRKVGVQDTTAIGSTNAPFEDPFVTRG
jgi:hypothetical protein